MTFERNSLTQKESQARLAEASDKYLCGEISRSEFKAFEKQYGIDYSSATLELSGIGRQVLRWARRLPLAIARTRRSRNRRLFL